MNDEYNCEWMYGVCVPIFTKTTWRIHWMRTRTRWEKHKFSRHLCSLLCSRVCVCCSACLLACFDPSNQCIVIVAAVVTLASPYWVKDISTCESQWRWQIKANLLPAAKTATMMQVCCTCKHVALWYTSPNWFNGVIGCARTWYTHTHTNKLNWRLRPLIDACADAIARNGQ